MTLDQIRLRIIRLRREQRLLDQRSEEIVAETRLLLSEAACTHRRRFATTLTGRANLLIDQFTPPEIKKRIRIARKIAGI